MNYTSLVYRGGLQRPAGWMQAAAQEDVRGGSFRIAVKPPLFEDVSAGGEESAA
jgi:hypothetical protein